MKRFSFLRRYPIIAWAAAVCLIAAGVVGAVILTGHNNAVDAPVSGSAQVEVEKPKIGILPTTKTPEDEPEEEEPAVEETVAAPAELLPSVVSPLDGTTVTVFSMTELLYDQTMADWRTHDGVDIQAGEGDAVKTAAGGTVQSVKRDDLMGTVVTIAHSGGYTTTYASLREKPPVTEGQTVKAGDIIGYVGTTASAEMTMGPHLHFSVSKDGEVINPEEYIK